MKNSVILEHYCPQEKLRPAYYQFVHHYNHGRYHLSLDLITPAEIYDDRYHQFMNQRARIKQ
jgi:putative transposase